MTLEGALLKLTHETRELRGAAGEPVAVRLKLSRAEKLKGPALVELMVDDETRDLFRADPLTVPAGQTEAVLRVEPRPGGQPAGRHTLSFRATVMQEGNLPVIAHTSARYEAGSTK
jgi:hypothetical protein